MRIDIASFTCTCGHRCTPPEAVNAFANEMEVLERHALTRDVTGRPISTMDKGKRKSDMEKKFKGNSVTVKTEGDEDVVRIARSYAKVSSQDATELTESKHVVLSCPECGALLYEAQVR